MWALSSSRPAAGVCWQELLWPSDHFKPDGQGHRSRDRGSRGLRREPAQGCAGQRLPPWPAHRRGRHRGVGPLRPGLGDRRRVRRRHPGGQRRSDHSRADLDPGEVQDDGRGGWSGGGGGLDGEADPRRRTRPDLHRSLRGNIDLMFLGKAVRHGLEASGRFAEYTVLVPDQPGNCPDAADDRRRTAATSFLVEHHREGFRLPFRHGSRSRISVETRDADHASRICATPSEPYRLTRPTGELPQGTVPMSDFRARVSRSHLTT